MCDTDYMHVKDVYDLAYLIAQEFNKLESLDVEEATPLIDKVIYALELLEESANHLESLGRENGDLKVKYLQLLNEKSVTESEKLNLLLTFEELEDSWIEESKTLKLLIQNLKEENTSLQSNIIKHTNLLSEKGQSFQTVVEDQENFISQLKVKLQEKEKQSEEDIKNIDNLNTRVRHLFSLNKSLSIMYGKAKVEAEVCAVQGNEFQAKLNVQSQQIDDLKKDLNAWKAFLLPIIKQKCNEECLQKRPDMFIARRSREQNKLKHKVEKLEMEMTSMKRQSELFRKNLLAMAAFHNIRSVHKPSHFKQIFQLFLGMFAIS